MFKRFSNQNCSPLLSLPALALVSVLLASCADVSIPGARNLNVPSIAVAEEPDEAVNDVPDSVVYLPLGNDVLIPDAIFGTALPSETVGPFELRSETLAGALQLILADYEIPIAFETEEGLTRTITVTNLRGPLDGIVNRVCGLADLYCAFEDGVLVVKETQIFTVSVPPVGGDIDLLDTLSSGVDAITGGTSISEEGTRTLIYEATNRSAPIVDRYFQRLRASTALITFEINIWEVGLDSVNSTGIDWEQIDVFGAFETGISIPGGAPLVESPISIGLPSRTGVAFDSENVIEFLSTQGAVKTISQPQVTMLSGTEAFLRVADTQNFVSSISQTIEGDQVTVATQTDSVDTGFSLTISSDWDQSTVYGTLDLSLQEVGSFDTFAEGTANEVSLPNTTERELQTQIRIRPGDSLLIAGLVSESDEFDDTGPGFESPIFSTARSAQVDNTEIVILIRPKVVVFTADAELVQANSGNKPSKLVSDDIFPSGSLSWENIDPSL